MDQYVLVFEMHLVKVQDIHCQALLVIVKLSNNVFDESKAIYNLSLFGDLHK